MNKLLSVFITSSIYFASTPVFASSYLTKLCASTVFRETPFTDTRCAKEISVESATNRKHLKFVYDSNGRLVLLAT